MEISEGALAALMEKTFKKHINWEGLEKQMTSLQKVTEDKMEQTKNQEEQVKSLKKTVDDLKKELKGETESNKYITSVEFEKRFGENQTAIMEEIEKAKREVTEKKNAGEFGADTFPQGFDTSLEKFFDKTLEGTETRFQADDLELVKEWLIKIDNMENMV